MKWCTKISNPLQGNREVNTVETLGIITSKERWNKLPRRRLQGLIVKEKKVTIKPKEEELPERRDYKCGIKYSKYQTR